MLDRAGNIIKQLNLCIMTGLIIVLPFATDDSLMFPTQSAKFFLFCLATIAIVSLFLAQIIFQKNSKHLPPLSHSQRTQRKSGKTFQFTTLDILLAVFILYAGASVLLHITDYGISHRFIELLGFAALYLVFRRLDTGAIKVLFVALLVSGAAQAIYGNLQLYGVFPSNHKMFSITGGFFNPGPYAGYLAVIFPMALVMYFASSGDKKIRNNDSKLKLFKKLSVRESEVFQYVSLVALITIVLVLPATRSRAAWLAVIAASAFIIFDKYNIRQEIKNRVNSMARKIALVTFAVILTGSAITGLYIMKKGSADGRLLIWKVTINMIGEKPLFGFGYDRFKANYLNFQAEYFYSESLVEDSEGRKATQAEAVVADNTTRAFNEYLQVTVDGGIVGLLLILAIGWTGFFGKLENKEEIQKSMILAARMSFVAFGVFALFSYPTEILPIRVCLIVCFALIASHQKKIDIKIHRVINSAKVTRPMIIVGSIAGLFVVFSLANPLMQQYKTIQQWKLAYLTYQMGAYEASLSEYSKSYKQLKYNGDYLVNYGKACSMAGEHENAIGILARAERYLPNTIVYTTLGDSYKTLGQNNKAEQAYFKAAQILPDRFYPKYLLAKLFDETNQRSKALEIANELLQKEIKIESMAVKEIKAEMQAIVGKSKLSSS